MFYSKSTGCFYPDDIHYENQPEDLIKVSEDEFNAAMARSPGETIDVIGGRLTILPAPVVSVADQFLRLKTTALTTIDHFHAETVQQLVGNPTQVEKDTWALKLEIANAITSKAPISPAGQSFLQSANITTGAAQAEWATSVLAKSAAYATVVGLAEALRSTARAAVKAATDQASLESALAAHRTAAEEAKASLAKRS